MFLRFVVTLASMLCSANAYAQAEKVRVVWTDAPHKSATVLWNTKTADPAKLSYGTQSQKLAADYESMTLSTATRPDEDDDAWVHSARLQYLDPNTVVHFRITAEGATTRDYWFRTAPVDSAPFSLLYGGDSRSDSEMRRAMNRRVRDLIDTDPSIIALAHGGDYIATGSSWAQWERWLDDWQESIPDDGQVLPIIPARGNHEGDGELFNVVFGQPGAPDIGGDWYVTRLGNDFAIVTLDSNVSQSGDQRTWLDKTLRDLQSTRWIIANYHRPAYPAVKSPGGALYHWVPLFEQYNVDFVLESDGHVLKRTVPIRADQPDPTGIVYLGEGGLGVPQRTPDTSRWYLEPPGVALSSHHIQLFRISREKVTYQAIDAEGELIDRYEFKPRRVGQDATDSSNITALPIGKPPPPPNPPLFQCSAAPVDAPAEGLWFAAFSAFWLGRRRRRKER